MSEKPQPIEIVNTHRELHMMGEVVAVCWNTKTEIVTRSIEGVEYSGQKRVRVGAPYIDFVALREDHGERYEDDDSPASGGLSAAYARQLAAELLSAADYIESLETRAS